MTCVVSGCDGQAHFIQNGGVKFFLIDACSISDKCDMLECGCMWDWSEMVVEKIYDNSV